MRSKRYVKQGVGYLLPENQTNVIRVGLSKTDDTLPEINSSNLLKGEFFTKGTPPLLLSRDICY